MVVESELESSEHGAGKHFEFFYFWFTEDQGFKAVRQGRPHAGNPLFPDVFDADTIDSMETSTE